MAEGGEVISLPQKVEIEPDNIPAEFKNKKKWVLWKWEKRKNSKEEKLTKPPRQINGKLADVSNPDTWATFEAVLEALKSGKFHGIGYVLDDSDGVVGWDFDHCINPKNGAIDPNVENIIKRINTYTEITPSGEGLRSFCFGDIPEAGRKSGNIETYKNLRYLTLTGIIYPGFPASIQQGDPASLEEFKRIHIVGASKELKSESKNHDSKIALLIEGKWDEAGYPSQSEADMAFCRYLAEETDGNAERIDELFRESKLFRAKWDKKHHGDGSTYGQYTIRLALNSYNNAANLTDLGNAKRFAGLIREEVRYCLGNWFIWDEKRLEQDRTQKIYRMTDRVFKKLKEEFRHAMTEDRKKKIWKHILELEGRAKLENMVRLTQFQPDIHILPEQLDANPLVFNCESGLINQRAEIIPHAFEHLITKLAPVKYNPLSISPNWFKFLFKVLPEEPVRDFVQRAIGYSMTGLVTEQVLFFAYGTGANGKSTFFNMIMKVFGDYASSLPVESLMATKNDQHPTVLADLRGVRLVLASEPEDGRRFNEGLLKQITGGERIVARRMREDFSRFDSSAKLWIMGNHKPTIRGTDYAIWRRIRLIPFTITIPKEEQDQDLWQKLEQEKEGIFKWCVEGLKKWLDKGLDPPEAVIQATEEYKEEMDILGEFVSEQIIAVKGKWTLHSEIYGKYSQIMKDKNERILSSRVFAQKLREKGFKDERRTGNQLYWADIQLKNPQHRQQDEM